jgi:GDP-L-fucose synthase
MIHRYWSATQDGAHEVKNWGTGTPRREVMYADDFASALTFLFRVYESGEPINIGTGSDHSISEIAEEISRLVGFQGTTIWDSTRPDGAPRKLLDVTKLTELGWASDWPLTQGLERTIDGFLRKIPTLKGNNA